MTQPTLFVDINERNKQMPLTKAVKESFGAKPVDTLTSESGEADIAVVDTAAKAYRCLFQTARTTIIIAYLRGSADDGGDELATHLPNRVIAVNFAGKSNREREQLATVLLPLIQEKASEKSAA